ncbi:MAG: TfoX/Sxy family protein [Micrococcales bacterium]|nr:TfoX/Sxy family protein [Micrococcales bacterium]
MTPGPSDDRTRELIDRIRAGLPDRPMREVRMFGVTALMVDETLAGAAGKDGSLLVRVDPADDAALLLRPHASRAEMGAGRRMGAGWIRVAAEALRSDAALGEWLRAAADNLARLEAGTPASRGGGRQ